MKEHSFIPLIISVASSCGLECKASCGLTQRGPYLAFLAAIESHCLHQELCLTKTKEVLNRDRNNPTQHQSLPSQPSRPYTRLGCAGIAPCLGPVRAGLSQPASPLPSCTLWALFSLCWLLKCVKNPKEKIKNKSIALRRS